MVWVNPGPVPGGVYVPPIPDAVYAAAWEEARRRAREVAESEEARRAALNVVRSAASRMGLVRAISAILLRR